MDGCVRGPRRRRSRRDRTAGSPEVAVAFAPDTVVLVACREPEPEEGTRCSAVELHPVWPGDGTRTRNNPISSGSSPPLRIGTSSGTPESNGVSPASEAGGLPSPSSRRDLAAGTRSVMRLCSVLKVRGARRPRKRKKPPAGTGPAAASGKRRALTPVPPPGRGQAGWSSRPARAGANRGAAVARQRRPGARCARSSSCRCGSRQLLVVRPTGAGPSNRVRARKSSVNSDFRTCA